MGLAGAQLLDAYWSGDPAKQQEARRNAGFLTDAAIVPWVGRFLAQGLAMDAGFSALKAGAVAGAGGNGLGALIGAGFTGISAVEAYQAARDLSEGKQGAGYALATIGKAARPSLSLTAGGLTILSVATRLCPMAYSIAEKTGVIQSARIARLTRAGQVAVAAARKLPASDTQAARTVVV